MEGLMKHLKSLMKKTFETLRDPGFQCPASHLDQYRALTLIADASSCLKKVKIVWRLVKQLEKGLEVVESREGKERYWSQIYQSKRKRRRKSLALDMLVGLTEIGEGKHWQN